MDPVAVGILGIVILVLLFVIEFPVAFALGFVGFLGFGYLVSFNAGFEMLSIDIFESFSSYNLTVIPMFVFMGCLAFEIGMSTRLFDASHAIFGKMRGGLAVAAIMACAGFAAICGSTNATAAAMGAVSLPQMKRYHYDDSLATGSVAAAGKPRDPYSAQRPADCLRHHGRGVDRETLYCRCPSRSSSGLFVCPYRNRPLHAESETWRLPATPLP